MRKTIYRNVIDTALTRLYCLYTQKDVVVFLGTDINKLGLAVKNLGCIFDKIIIEDKKNVLAEEEIKGYMDGKVKSFTLKPLFLTGSDFEKKVWSSTLEIKYGHTATYGDIAIASGRPKAFRAVGSALSKNPFFLIVPCHRVIRSDGSIGGFASGSKLKARLLRLEGIKT